MAKPTDKKTAKKTAAKKTATSTPGPVLLKKRPLPTKEELQKKARELKAKQIGDNVVEIVKQKCTQIRYDFSDGTILFAEGRHASVLFEFLQECEQLCTVQGFAAYNGTGLQRFANEDAFLSRDEGPIIA